MPSGVTLDMTVTDDGGDYYIIGESPRDQIIAMTGLVGWWQANPDFVTTSGIEVTQVDPLNGSIAILEPTSSLRRPTIVADQVVGLEGFVFDSVALDSFYMTGATPDFNSDFTLVAFFKMNTLTGDQTVIGSQESATLRAAMWTLASDGNLRMSYGSTGTAALPIDAGAWHLAIGAYDESAALVRLMVNGASASGAVTINTGGNQELAVGALNQVGSLPLNGVITDAMFFNRDMLDSPAAADLAILRAYFQNVYGVS